MDVPAELIDADLERQFADWGVPVTYQLVAIAFDPETLTASETVDETETTALASTNKAGTTPDTGAALLDPQTSFTVRTAELPAATAGQVRRLVAAGVVYDVIGVDVLPVNRVTTLRCRKRGDVE